MPVFENNITGGTLRLITHQSHFDHDFDRQGTESEFQTFAWNTGPAQLIFMDEVPCLLEANTVLPIMMNQSFRFEHPENIIAWQFNQAFYCIVNHDAEVGCVGFLFFGPSPTMFIALDDQKKQKMQEIKRAFEEEFESKDDLKEEMLRMLLARLIIELTRIAKLQYLGSSVVEDAKFDTVRFFNLLVEQHYKKEHQVGFYAAQLNKSPKTIANLFGKYYHKTPLEIIHTRLISEAKRMFHYTPKSVKEIATELGFDEATHFSKLFKKHTQLSPKDFRKSLQMSN